MRMIASDTRFVLAPPVAARVESFISNSLILETPIWTKRNRRIQGDFWDHDATIGGRPVKRSMDAVAVRVSQFFRTFVSRFSLPHARNSSAASAGLNIPERARLCPIDRLT